MSYYECEKCGGVEECRPPKNCSFCNGSNCMKLCGPYQGLTGEQFAFVSILVLAKAGREFSDGASQDRFARIARLAHEALGEPSMAELDRMEKIIGRWPHEVA